MANSREQETQHALLVILGKFAQEMGLISGIEGVKLGQKSCDHTPQSKVLEFWWRSYRVRSICRTSVLQRTRWIKM
jgi:hypothetical protein